MAAFFVNDRLGKFPGALSMSDVNLIGIGADAPALHLCGLPQLCGGMRQQAALRRGVHDTARAPAWAAWLAVSRAETRNFMAAIGPDFKAGYADPPRSPMPTSRQPWRISLGIEPAGQRRTRAG